MDLSAFQKNVDASLAWNEEAFQGTYAAELAALQGLSGDQLNQLCPTPQAQQDYANLLSVVKEASRTNVDQAALRDKILSLGGNAVKIAKSVDSLAVLL